MAMVMSVSRLARALLPPVLADGIRWLIRPGRDRFDNLKTYDTFAEALTQSDSFSHPDIVAFVATRTKTYRQALAGPKVPLALGDRLLQNLFVVSHVARQIGPAEVVELGGACGATFFVLDRLLPDAIQAWNVVELPVTVEAGRAHFESGRLKFFSDLETAKSDMRRRGLLMTQGGLQCVEDPLPMLAHLLALEFDYVYITRFEVSDELERPVIVRLLDRLSANGPGPIPTGLVDRDTSYPATIFPTSALVSAIPDNYQIAFFFDESIPRRKRFGTKSVKTRKIGMLLERRGR
jgi:putative methyltransferase (TIGR04325 family)